MSDTQVFWSLDNDLFIYNSKEAALLEAQQESGIIATGTVIYFASASLPDVTTFINTDAIIQTIRDEAQLLHGTPPDNALKIDASGVSSLSATMKAWAKNSVTSMFYVLGESTAYQVTEADLALVETPEQRMTRLENDFLEQARQDIPEGTSEADTTLILQGALAAFRRLTPA